MKDFIDLSGGDPEIEAPNTVIETALRAIKDGGKGTHYSGRTPHPKAFQEAVVEYYSTVGPEYRPRNVIPTAGGSAALYIALATTLDRGDEALLWSPFYAGHPWILDEMEVKMNLAPLNRETGYHPDMDNIQEYITEGTRAIVLCNPANPTGTVFTEEELKAIVEVAIDQDLAIISDEIYLHYVYHPAKFVAPSSFPSLRERTINVMSFSKTFSMTGWRLGYLILPDEYREKAQRVARMIAARPATFTLMAGTAALKGDFSYVKKRQVEYKKRRDYFVKAMNDLGLYCHLFEGAFYAWVDASSTGLSSRDFVAHLKKAENMELSPGGMFGDDSHIRVPLVQPVPILEDAVDRISRFLDSL
jgi:aspartate/methionine/tyrosine aminotransferase